MSARQPRCLVHRSAHAPRAPGFIEARPWGPFPFPRERFRSPGNVTATSALEIVVGFALLLGPDGSLVTRLHQISPRELGAVLQSRRKALSMSTEHAAKLVGVNPSHLSRLEDGDGKVELQLALLLIQALGYDIDLHVNWAHAPRAREYEMFRLRAVDGLTLDEIAEIYGLHRERVRQILKIKFRLGEPFAANARQQARRRKRYEQERLARLASARAHTPLIIAQWRSGAEPKQIARAVGVFRVDAETIIHTTATDADRAARRTVLGRGWRATSRGRR